MMYWCLESDWLGKKYFMKGPVTLEGPNQDAGKGTKLFNPPWSLLIKNDSNWSWIKFLFQGVCF